MMSTSDKGKSAKKKLLPMIPIGVEPAVSPHLARPNPALTQSPLLPRSLNTPGQNRTQTSSKLNISALNKTQAPSKRKEKAGTQKSDGEDSTIRVAVRVRPFSKREQVMGAKQVISMTANRTTITSAKGNAHFFSYDHCFWSVDNPSGMEGVGGYAGQHLVYSELAQPLLDNAFRGYNTCLFAYGQTGSGKSYCIMGEGEELGIVPRFMKELFDRIDGTSDSKNTFNVQVSYFEIYNEKVYDLLNSNTGKPLTPGRKRHKLRVREHQVFGPYVEDLSTYAASSYADIEHWLKIGNRCRATNATSMNDRSSRSHAVFSVTLTHTMVEREEEHNTVSRINIIDLAGSERSKVADTTGERLKEGASINRSLHSLGKVISLLSEHSSGRRDKVYIPYRDSTLTWLLKESLGGNSKTAMLATISPADIHYEESLGTLRYAQQARSIVNVARVNEDPNVKMIRELTSEIEELRGLLSMQGGQAGLVELKKLREQLSESEKLMAEATRSWQEKLQETERRKKEELEQLKLTGSLMVNNKLPNLVNLTEDPQLSETLLYVLKPGTTTVGNASATQSHDTQQVSHDIELTGALVIENHCMFVYEETSVQLEPSANPDAQTYVNGQLLSAPKLLHHGDRVVLGGDYFFRFNYPLEVGGMASNKKGHKDFEFARNELVKAQRERFERELEEKILKERKEMLNELEGVQLTAQVEIDRQQAEYQQRIQALSQEMATQSQHLTVEQETKQAAEMRVEQLLQQNQLLEEETIAQRHIIHLEKIKTEKESKELEEQRNQLMLDLELEKHRLEEDIDKLNKNKSIREVHLSPSSSDSLLTNSQSSGSESNLLSLHRGSEVMRVSMMLQEAAAICKALNKPLSFTREEGGAGEGLSIRVSNTLLNVITYWDMSKFEMRLEQMREMYQARGSLSSLEEQGTMSPTFSEDPFNAPSDSWVPSPLRSIQRSHSLQSTPSLTTPTSANRRLPFDLYNTLHSKSSNYSSPQLSVTPLRERPHPSANSTVAMALQQVSQLLDWKEDSFPEDVLATMLRRVDRVRKDCEGLAYLHLHPDTTTTPDGTAVEGLAVSLCCCLELLAEGNKALHQTSLHWQSLMADYLLLEHTCALDVTSQLQETLCHKTALYCKKLMKSEEQSVIEECRQEVCSSLDTVTELLGQLLLAREVQERLLMSRLSGALRPHTSHAPSTSSMNTEDSDCRGVQWPACQHCTKCSLLRGVCNRCTSSIDMTGHCLQTSMAQLRTRLTSQQRKKWLEALEQLIGSAVSFLDWLQSIQKTMWSEDGEACLPLPPVVTMLTSLYQLANSISRLSHAHLNIADHSHNVIPAESVKAIGVCNQLAVSVLGVLKTSEAGKVLASHVQAHAQSMSQAGKAINHLIKNGTLRIDSEL